MENALSDPSSLEKTPESGAENPLAFLEGAMNGVRCYQAFITAYDAGIFEMCREEKSVEEISRSTGFLPNLVKPLCEGLVRIGLLRKTETRTYAATPYACDFFLSTSPFPQRAALAQLRQFASLSLRLPELLIQGPVTYPRGEQFRQGIIPAMAENSRCGLVQRVATLVSRLPEFSSARRMLDLGGGHGLYSIALCRKNPGLMAVVFDLPEVTGATQEFIQSYGATEQVTPHNGDFFRDPLGSGYDIVFSSSNPSGKMPDLIPKIRDALNPGGLYFNKQVIDEPEPDPFSDLEWNLWTFEGMRKQGRRYRFEGSVSLAEYNRVLGESGFTVSGSIPVDERSSMTIARKNVA